MLSLYYHQNQPPLLKVPALLRQMVDCVDVMYAVEIDQMLPIHPIVFLFERETKQRWMRYIKTIKDGNDHS